MKSLGKKTFWWYVRAALLTPFWLLYPGDRKTWDEFRNGLVKHKCEYDYDDLRIDKLGGHYCCKHYGCTIITMRNKDGSWIN